MKAKQLPLDKTKHFMAGVFIAAIFGYIVGLWVDPISAALSGLAAAVLIGTAKEAIWDNWLKKGVDDKYDMYATALGGVLGALILVGFLECA
jgi:hypothetical protein